MSVGLLLVTHGHIGDEMLEVARKVFTNTPMRTATLGINDFPNPEALLAQAQSLAGELDEGDGVLVLSDAFGATPCNVATRLTRQGRVEVIAGLNLPMLMRVLNYATLSLAELSEKALDGGRIGVVRCQISQ